MERASVVDPLSAAQRALLAGDWAAAREAFTLAVGDRASADALDGLGLARWWLKDVAGALEARSRAYAALRREGRLAEAARVAVWLAREHRRLYRNHVVADGWLARARRLNEAVADQAVQGWIAVAEAEALRDTRRAVNRLDGAAALARLAEDPDLEIVVLARQGVAEISVGDVDVGLRHLDEAMVAATAGEGRDPQSLGEAVCALMEVAGLLGDAERVASWAAAMDAYSASYPFPPMSVYGLAPTTTTTDALSAFCGTCCGSIYLVTGRLDDAEVALRATIAELEASQTYSRCVHPVSQLAELRVIQGRLEEAALLLADFQDLPECVRPLATLDLAQGAPDRAAARLQAGIADLGEQQVTAFSLWTLLVDAWLAHGDLDAADGAAQEVARIAALTGSARHLAESAFAAAKVTAARDTSAALPALREAARLLAGAQLPLAACRARMAYARALADTDTGAAVAEAGAALSAFDRLGATADADQAARFLRDLGVRGRTGPKAVGTLSRREQEVLRLLASGLSNGEIAARLHISVKTAGHHVSHILAKLGLRSRTEAAAFAVLHLPRDAAPR